MALGKATDKTALLGSDEDAGEMGGIRQDTLTWKTKIIYGLGGWPHGLTDTVINFYWTPYLLEVCGIPPIKASSIILAGRIFDAFTDPIVGYLITKTKIKWGQLRPWMACSIIPVGLTYIAIWIKPTGSTENGLLAYFMAMFLLYNLCLTCYYVPYTALIVHLSNSAAERNSATSTRIACQVLGVVISVAVTGAVVNVIDPSDATDPGSCRLCSDPVPVSDDAAELAHFVPSAIISLLAVLLGALCVAFTWEQKGVELATAQAAADGAGENSEANNGNDSTAGIKTEETAAAEVGGVGSGAGIDDDVVTVYETEEESFKDGVKLVFKSKNFKIILVAQMLAWMANTVNSANLKLYYKYVYCREEVFDLSTTLLLVALMLSIPLWYAFSAKYGKVAALTTSMLLFIPGCFSLGFNPRTTPTSVTILLGIWSGFTLGAIYLIPWMMLTDAIDEHELKTGKRHEAIFYSFLVFFTKLATGVISSISTALLELYGYDADACCANPDERECDSQPQSVETVLRYMFAMIAPILMIIAIIVLRFYDLSSQRHGEIKAELEKKRLALLNNVPSAHEGGSAPTSNTASISG